MWKESWLIMILVPLISATLSSAQEKRSTGTIRIGVTKMDSHPALDADEKGFEKALADAGFKEGTGVVYDRQNARGEMANAQAIAKKFLDAKVDLIHSIATPTSQTVVKVVKNIPVVFSAVTDPVDAGLVPRNSPPGTRTGTNVTGVSDRWPVYLQFEMYMKFVPKAKKWGTIYNARDANALVHIKEMREAAKKLGADLVEATISNSAETVTAAQFLAGKVQAIHITSDNTAVSSFEAIAKVCNEKKIPLFAGDVSTVPRGGIAAYGLDYFLIGISAGWKAGRILSGQKPGDIPWGPSDSFSLVVNEKAARAQGLAIPPVFLKIANKVISN
jgi:putative tryptophan/tyrosine transport system substrate-binding protein